MQQRLSSEHYVIDTSSTNIWKVECNLRKARRKSGCGTVELSKLVGISISRLYAIENKQTGVTLSEINLIARSLNVDPEYIKEGLRIITCNRHLLKSKKEPQQ